MGEFLTPKEAADFLRRSVGSIYNLKCAGRLPCYKPGGRKILFRRDDLEAWVQAAAIPSNDEVAAQAARR